MHVDTTSRDPKSIVTPHAFRVAPELLGTPLAHPWRRLVAMLIDLILVGILALVGGRVFWILAALVVFRIARPSTGGIFTTLVARLAARSVAILMIVITLGVWAVSCINPEISVPSEDAAGGVVRVRPLDLLRAPANIEQFRTVESDSVAARLADDLVRQLLALGTRPEELRGAVDEMLASEELTPARAEIALAAIERSAPPGQPAAGEPDPGRPDEREGVSDAVPTDSLVVWYAAALVAGDSARLDELRRPLAEEISRERISRLEQSVRSLDSEVDDLEAERHELEAQLAEERRVPGIRRLLEGLLEDLGLSFGWMALYFTAFVAMMGGQTPGKRLLGLRVVRLSGKPLTWWIAFERFGGYGASVFTGMLGFAEILWDPNRQAMHDKLARTVVIRTRKSGRRDAQSSGAASSL